MAEPEPEAPRVLVVEDDRSTAVALRASLAAAGYAVSTAGTAAEALETAGRVLPHAVVLDLILPDGGGIEVCRRLREWTQAPIIVLSGVGEEDDKVEALDAGADDYVTKPFALGELLARIRAALRRQPGRDEREPVRFGDVELDLVRRRVTRGGRAVHLTPREYDLLRALAEQPGRVLTHQALLRQAWGVRAGTPYRLRLHVASLRRKLEEEPGQPRHLITETGVGYRLTLEPW